MMTESIVQYKSQNGLYIWATLSLAISILGGYYIALWNLPILDGNILAIILWFFLLTFGLSFIDFYLGWKFKRSGIEYSSPSWDFNPIQLKINDARNLPRQYNRKFLRLVAVPNFWYYFLPIIFIDSSITLPLYSHFIDSSIEVFIPFGFAMLLTVATIVSLWGGWRSTSNKASGDFLLPLIHEAVKIASIQSNVIGISNTRIVLDKAEVSGYEIYRNPRVVSRVSGIEQDAYIESSAEELGSVEKVLVRSYKNDAIPDIIWWWSASDRNFRKYVGEKQEGYYVKNPVPSRVKELGVKDVKLIFENAVALLVLERIRLLGPNDELSRIISELGIE
ncbi:MAG: hypothetical protein ACFFF4_05360 [Candidatus Thorarchaeota archaeon]